MSERHDQNMASITAEVKLPRQNDTLPKQPLTVIKITHKLEYDVHYVDAISRAEEVADSGDIPGPSNEAEAKMAAIRSAAPEEALVDDDAATSQEPFDLANKSVIKATVLLKELGRHRQGITVTDLAQAGDVTRPTAFRLLLGLEQTGFVQRVDNRYVLGWQVARLGRLANPYAGAVARIQPILDEYAGRINETFSFVMVHDEGDHKVIAEALASRYLSVSHQYLGGIYPLHASATGKLILAEQSDDRIAAELPETLDSHTPFTITSRDALLRELGKVRDQGYAILDNELEEGLFAVGCPIRDSAGELIGVVTVNGPTQRLKSERLPETIDAVRQAADKVAAVLA